MLPGIEVKRNTNAQNVVQTFGFFWKMKKESFEPFSFSVFFCVGLSHSAAGGCSVTTCGEVSVDVNTFFYFRAL